MSIASSFQPLKLCMGIIAAPIDVAREALTRRLDSIIDVRAYTSTECLIDWVDFFVENGMNYNVFKTKMVLFKAADNLTIYTSTSADGWSSLYDNMIKDARFDAYFFSRKLNNEDNYYVFEMKVWKSGVLDRHVRVLKAEDGWEFLSEGSLAPFEDAEFYKKRRIADRLNQEAIESYSAAAGFPISSVVEYQGPAVLFYRP